MRQFIRDLTSRQCAGRSSYPKELVIAKVQYVQYIIHMCKDHRTCPGFMRTHKPRVGLFMPTKGHLVVCMQCFRKCTMQAQRRGKSLRLKLHLQVSTSIQLELLHRPSQPSLSYHLPAPKPYFTSSLCSPALILHLTVSGW